MEKEVMIWIIFFCFMILFNVIYQIILWKLKIKHRAIITLSIGFIIGLVSMLISLKIVG